MVWWNYLHRSVINNVFLTILISDYLIWLTEREHASRKVKPGILVGFKFIVALDILIDFRNDAAGDHSGGCGNGWDDPSCNHAALVSVAWLNKVVHCSEVRECINKINVEVGVNVLFKLCRV